MDVDAVVEGLDSESSMRALRASEELPAKTTEWMAPSLAQASMAKKTSGIRGR